MSSATTDRLNGINSGLAFKAPCRTATTANITLSGLQTIDGVTVVADDRVLVKDQTDQTENGIYVASSSTWSRALDFDGSRDVVQGTLVLATAGTTAAGQIYQLTTANPVTIDSSNLTFSAIAVSTANAILTGLGAMGTGTGIVAQTDADTFAKRTLTGTANQVAISNGDGVSGDPTFTLPQDIGTSSSPQFSSIAFNTAGGIKTVAGAGSTMGLYGYDVNDAVYRVFITVTANNVPTCDLDDSVTKASNYIYRADGTDVPLTDGGTGASTAANARVNLEVDQIDYIETDGTTPTTPPTVDAAAQDAMAIGSGSSVGSGGTGAIAMAGGTASGAGSVAIIGTTSNDLAVSIGSGNTASGAGASTVGGASNTASNTFTTVVGGSLNTASGDGSVVVGGGSNTASGGVSFATGGSNTASGGYSFVSGLQAAATLFGEEARAIGKISTVGDRQKSDLFFAGVTTTNTPKEIFIDGSSSRLTIPTDTSYGFKAYLLARRSDADDESAFYEFFGLIDNNAGTTALVSSVQTGTPIEDTAGWAAAFTADDTNDALVLTVTGENSKTIQWFCCITILKIKA